MTAAECAGFKNGKRRRYAYTCDLGILERAFRNPCHALFDNRLSRNYASVEIEIVSEDHRIVFVAVKEYFAPGVNIGYVYGIDIGTF